MNEEAARGERENILFDRDYPALADSGQPVVELGPNWDEIAPDLEEVGQNCAKLVKLARNRPISGRCPSELPRVG